MHDRASAVLVDGPEHVHVAPSQAQVDTAELGAAQRWMLTEIAASGSTLIREEPEIGAAQRLELVRLAGAVEGGEEPDPVAVRELLESPDAGIRPAAKELGEAIRMNRLVLFGDGSATKGSDLRGAPGVRARSVREGADSGGLERA